jgi:hypothetical protein
MKEVARLIADPPPEWMIVGLEHFSDGLAPTNVDREHFFRVIDQMRDATDTLLRWLPLFEHLPYGLSCPKEVEVALAVLPSIRASLERVQRKPGKPPNVPQELCAGVISEAWRRHYGQVNPRSDRLYEACQAYWEACGGVPLGPDASLEDYWRGYVKKGVNELVRVVLEGCETGLK